MLRHSFSLFTLLIIVCSGCDSPSSKETVDVEVIDEDQTPAAVEQIANPEVNPSPPIEELPEVPLPENFAEDIFIPEGKVIKIEESDETTHIEVELASSISSQKILLMLRDGLKVKGWTEKSYQSSPTSAEYHAAKDSRTYIAIYEQNSGPVEKMTIKVTSTDG